MLSRVRMEAEGGTVEEVERILYAASEALTQDAANGNLRLMFGEGHEGLADAQCGEMVIERFAKDLGGEPGHGAIFWRGRMTTHYAPRTPTLDLRQPDTAAGPIVYSQQ